jgi:tetratricopeptide (TPR) repeat protein
VFAAAVAICFALVAQGAGLTPAAAGPAPTQADTARLVEQARSHFDAGNAHYAAGRYNEAIQQFQAGYALVPRPNFLVNLGQAYRKLGDLARAKESYVAYVRALPQNSALRDQALQVLAEIEVQIQEQKGANPTQATAGPPPAPVVSRPAPAPAPAEASARSSIIAMSVAGAGVALAGTGLVFQLRAKSASDKLTALDRSQEPFDPALERRGRRDQRIGVGLLAAGGAALAAAITMYVLMGPTESTASFAVHPGELGLKVSF